MAGKGLRPNKVLDKELGAEKPKRAFHTFKKDLTKWDVKRIAKEKQEAIDEKTKHVEEHLGQIAEAKDLIVEGYKVLFIHPRGNFMTLYDPSEPRKKYTVNGSDNVSELYSYLRKFGKNYGIYLK